MDRARRPIAALLVAALALTAAPAARADDKATRAQARFDEGIALMQSGKLAAACPKLEESEALDPGMGTEFRLAECYEGEKRIAHAWALFSKVAEAAERGGLGDRAALAIKRAAMLRPRLPWLTIEVSPEAAAVAGVRVVRDALEVSSLEWGQKVAVDPGEHRITAKAPGMFGWESVITAVEGSALVVRIPVLNAVPPKPPEPPQDTGPGLSGMRVGALVSAGVGVAGVALGAGFGLAADSQWKLAEVAFMQCADKPCRDAAAKAGNDANSPAAVSTLGFVAGGAALVVAGILWFRGAPSAQQAARSLVLTPAAGPTLAGLGLAGRF